MRLSSISPLFIMVSIISFAIFGCAGKQIPKHTYSNFAKFDITKNKPLRPEYFNNIAIIPLVDAVNAQNSGKLVATVFQNAFDRFGFSTTDRIFVNSLLQERSAILSGLFGDRELKEIGEKLSAHYILTGAVTKYNSRQIEKKGDEITTFEKTVFGTIARTSHSENSLQELFNTGARLRLLNVETGNTDYEFEISIENSMSDNMKSFDVALQRHLIQEWIRAKRDSVVDSGKSTSGCNSKSDVRSILEDNACILGGVDSIEARNFYKRITDSSAFFVSNSSSAILIYGNPSAKYSYVDGEKFSASIASAVQSHYAYGDSLGVVNGLSFFTLLDSAEQATVQKCANENWNSFSDDDAFVLQDRYKIWISKDSKKKSSAFRKYTRPIDKL